MPDPTTATLSNGSVVKEGDVVPMTDGTSRKVSLIFRRSWPGLYLLHTGDYTLDGKPVSDPATSFYATPKPAIDLAKLAALAQSAPTVPTSDPLDGLPVERENMLAERQRLLDRKFAGDMAQDEALRLAFIRYGLDVWVEADAPTVTAERLRALAREFKMRSETAKKMANTTRYTFDRIAYENIEKTFVECAAALEALAGGGK